MARYTAVLDACVLVPIALADTLLRVAERGLYRPLWSERILDETAGAILEIHPDLPPDAVRRRIDAMNRSFEDALVDGWQDLEVIREQAAHTRRPSLAPTDLIARLARCGVPSFADDVSRMI
ncbi:MAG: hypothetical protein ACR2H3_09450 [Acidimicrobiales bacterium]